MITLCINQTSTDPYFNLAAEEYFLKNFQEDFFMLWRSRAFGGGWESIRMRWQKSIMNLCDYTKYLLHGGFRAVEPFFTIRGM